MERKCKNCETNLIANYNFCPNCGQEQKDKVVTFKQFILDFLGDYFTFDSLIIRSFRPLLFKPGFLTNEYLAGRRVRYIPPLRLFIFISIVFFLVLGPVDQAVQPEKSEEAVFLDRFFTVWFPRLFFLLLPLFAVFLFMLFRKPGRFYLTHFIFSVHFHAFVLVLLTTMVFLIDHVLPSSVFWSQWSLFTTISLLLIYLFVALLRVYDQRWYTTMLKLVVVLFMYTFSVMIIFSTVGALIFYW